MLKNILIAIMVLSTLLMSCGSGVAAYATVINVEDAYKKYEEGVFFLDVRTVAEWNEFHAPETTLIPLDELSLRLDEIPPNGEIVVVCRSGNSSQQGRDILINAGFEQATSMAGGLNQWRASGYPIVSGP